MARRASGTGVFQAEAAKVASDPAAAAGAPYMPSPYPLQHLGRDMPGAFLPLQEVRNPVVKPAGGRPYRSYGAWFQAHQHPEHDVVLGEVVELKLDEDVLETRSTNFWPYGRGVTELSASLRAGDNYRLGGKVIQEIVPRQYAGRRHGLGRAALGYTRRRSDEVGGRTPPTSCAGLGMIDPRTAIWTRRDLDSGRGSSAGGPRSAASSEQGAAGQGAAGALPRSSSTPSLGAPGHELRLGRTFAREARLGKPLPLPQWNI